MTVQSVDEEFEVVEERQLPQLTPEQEAKREAALRHVRKLGDPVLRAKALPVKQFDDRLKEEIARMEAIMTDSIGVGLAATQLGVMHRLLVYRLRHEEEAELVALVNPVIEWNSEETEIGEEGCLSLPGVVVDVERPVEVKVRALDADGNALEISASGLEARVIQHEVDHLDGILTIDRTSKEERKAALKILRNNLA